MQDQSDPSSQNQSLRDWQKQEVTNRNYVDLRVMGASGLKAIGGFVEEATLRDLAGRRAVEIYKDMGDNDATCSVILYALMQMIRQVEWTVAPASTAPFDVEAAEFVESCMHDMEGQSWTDFISESFMGMLRFGFSLHEQCFKRRGGDSPQRHLRSHYADGRVGWRGLPGRAQDTIYRWLFDDAGNLLGAEQQAPPHFRTVNLPIDKCLLFRTTMEKDNPEGRSIFRGAYRSWVLKRGLENIEATGVEKDISGLPIVWVPRELLAMAQDKPIFENGDPNPMVQQARAAVAMYRKMATEVRRDAHEGLVMPLDYDDQGHKRFDITLLQSGGSRAFDIDKIISRYDARIAMSTMSDFLLLGQGATAQGSWAMHSDKSKLWLQSIVSFLKVFIDHFNKNAVRKLMRLNTFEMSDYPRIEFGSLERVDLTEMGDLLTKCAQAGMELFPDDDLDAHVRRVAGWPERTMDLVDVSDVKPQPMDTSEVMQEIHTDDEAKAREDALKPVAGVVTNAPERNKHPLLNDTAHTTGY